MPQMRLSLPWKRRFRPLAVLLAAALPIALAACGKPPAPEKERPPEPRARDSDLRDAVRAPVGRAGAVEADVLEAAAAQRVAIDAASGG